MQSWISLSTEVSKLQNLMKYLNMLGVKISILYSLETEIE